MKYILRILASPFVLGIYLIRLNFIAFYRSFLFVRYGGQMITYDSTLNKDTILGTYNQNVEILKGISQVTQQAKDYEIQIVKKNEALISQAGEDGLEDSQDSELPK